jgi:phosphatidylglycerol:prolipoprotein diacylglycerol transferase
MLPVLFTLPSPWGPQPIYAYGVLLGLSLIVGYQIVVRVAAREDDLSEDVAGSAYLAAALCGIAGARLLYVLENRATFADTPASGWFDVTSGGVTAYGGFLGGLLGAAGYLAYKRASLAAFADAAAPALALGTVLTRVGCYLYGCDFGTPLSDHAPAFLRTLGTFPHWQLDELQIFGSPAFLYHVDRYGLSAEAPASLPVHPTQLYEALVGLFLLALSVVVLRRRRFRGQVILAVALGYAVLRFGFEYLRDDPERGQAFGFSIAQLISLALAGLCAVLYSILRTRARRAPIDGN